MKRQVHTSWKQCFIIQWMSSADDGICSYKTYWTPQWTVIHFVQLIILDKSRSFYILVHLIFCIDWAQDPLWYRRKINNLTVERKSANYILEIECEWNYTTLMKYWSSQYFRIELSKANFCHNFTLNGTIFTVGVLKLVSVLN